MKFTNIIAITSLMMMQGVSSFVQPIPFVGSSKTFSNTRIASSTKENDTDDFSAFAQSLEDDEEVFAAAASTSGSKQQQETWQAKLETFLDPRTSLAKRQILASELAASNEDIRDSVLTAVKDRKIDSLLTPTQKKLQDGTRAVARQLTNDILPKALENNPISSSDSSSSVSPPPPEEVLNALPKIGERLFKTFQSQAQKQFQEFQDDMADPFNKIPQRLSQQSQFVQNEVQNVFSETPSGLQEPSYTVVRETEEYEIRDYESYMVASTPISSDNDSSASFSLDDNVASGGSAFNTLASYLFGDNSEERTMEMTTPVTTTSLGEMRFYLAGSSSFPEPKSSQNDDSITSDSSKISLLKIPASRLAVRRFTGFVTDGEVSRQKQVLLSNLELDGEELDVKHGAVVPHVIFQYNPPYTLPVIRRNEIGIPLVIPSDSSLFLDNSNEMNGLSTASSADEDNEEEDNDGYDEDGSPSDY